MKAAVTASALASLALFSPGSATGQSWTWQPSGRAVWEYSDNPFLAPEPSPGGGSGRVAAGVTGSRSTETSDTRAAAELVWVSRLVDQPARMEGRIGLEQQLRLPRQSFGASLGWRREDPLVSPGAASDVVIGAQRRDSTEASGSAVHRFDERLQAQFTLSAGRTDYESASAGQDYRQASSSLGVDWLIDEGSSVGASLGGLQQESLDRSRRFAVPSLQLSGQRALSERWSLQASAGMSWYRRVQAFERRVCPLPISFCLSGLVPWIDTRQEFVTKSRQSIGSFGLAGRIDERSTASVSYRNALTPSGLGISREQSGTMQFGWRADERLDLGARYEYSRTRTPADTLRLILGEDARLQTLSIFATRQLQEGLSLQAVIEARHFERIVAQTQGRSHRIAITLQYNGPSMPLLR